MNRNNFFLYVAAITGLLIAILISETPPGVDDLLFMLPAKGHEPGVDLWNMMVGEFGRIWKTQSGRLGNFLAMPFLYLFPKWVFGLITGGLTTLLILLSCRLVGAERGSVVSWLLYATIILAYPWYDYLTLVTYAINYIWAAACVMAAMACFFNIERMKGIRLAAVCLLMFVAGWMHEGFGAPLTAGLTLSLIVNHKDIDKKQILAWICTGIGTGMTMLSPMFWKRSETETHLLAKFTYKEMMMQIGPAMLFVAVMIILILWTTSNSKLRKCIIKSFRLLVFVGATIGATAVCLKFYTGPRTGAPAILYGALACGYILTASTSEIKVGKAIKWSIGILISGFSILHLVYADIAQASRSREYQEITQLYEQSENGTFYYDLTYPEADLSLFKTSVRQFHEKVPKEFMRIYFNPDHKMVILPTDLKGFSREKARKSELTPGAMIFHGWPIVSDSVDTESFTRIHVLTEDGRYLPSRFRVDRFDRPNYGSFILITPHIKVLDPTIKIKDVAIHDHSR